MWGNIYLQPCEPWWAAAECWGNHRDCQRGRVPLLTFKNNFQNKYILWVGGLVFLFFFVMYVVYSWNCSCVFFTWTPSHCLPNRLKMDGGWGWKTANWEHFLQILSVKYLFRQKVCKDDFIISSVFLQMLTMKCFLFHRGQKWGQKQTQTC